MSRSQHWRRALAVQIARRVPFDVHTVERVLELAPSSGLKDPEEFLKRCSSTGLDPIGVLNFARAGLPVQPDPRPPHVRKVEIRLPRSRGWLFGGWIILTASLGALMGAIKAGSVLDASLCAALAGGAILVISVEMRRLP